MTAYLQPDAGESNGSDDDDGDFTVRREQNVVVVRLAGTVDTLNFAASIERVRRLAARDRPRVLRLDMREIDFLQTSALMKLSALDDEMRGAGGRLQVCGLRPQPAGALQLTNLAAIAAPPFNADAQGDGPSALPTSPARTDKLRTIGRPAARSSGGGDASSAARPVVATMSSGVNAATTISAGDRGVEEGGLARDNGHKNRPQQRRERACPPFSTHCYAKGAALSIALLVAALIFVFGRSEARAYNLCVRYQTEWEAMQQREATAADWANFQSRARRQFEPLIQSLAAKGAGRSPTENHLLAGIRHLLQLIDTAPAAAAEEHLQELRHHLSAIEPGVSSDSSVPRDAARGL